MVPSRRSLINHTSVFHAILFAHCSPSMQETWKRHLQTVRRPHLLPVHKTCFGECGYTFRCDVDANIGQRRARNHGLFQATAASRRTHRCHLQRRVAQHLCLTSPIHRFIVRLELSPFTTPRFISSSSAPTWISFFQICRSNTS